LAGNLKIIHEIQEKLDELGKSEGDMYIPHIEVGPEFGIPQPLLFKFRMFILLLVVLIL